MEITEKHVDDLVSDDEANDAMRAADQAWRDAEKNTPDRIENADRAANCGSWAAYYTDFPEWASREARTAMVWEKIEQGIDHRVANEAEAAQQSKASYCVTSSVTPSAPAPLISLGSRRTFAFLPKVFTKTVHSTGCRFWPTHFRTPGATTTTS